MATVLATDDLAGSSKLERIPSYNTATAQAALEALTPEQRVKYARSVAEALKTAKVQEALIDMAKEAANACKSIDEMFVSLTVSLTAIDMRYQSPKDKRFMPKLTRIHGVRN
jgi:hypothetical protein